MDLQELKQMVAEEYAAYKKSIKEQPAGGPPPPPADDNPTIAVSDDDIDVTGGDDAEGTLKDIFDMLKSYFEGEKDKDDDKADDTKSKDDDKEEVEENSTGANSGYKAVKESVKKKGTKAKLIKEMKSRNFTSRLQKLANIKK